MNFKFMAAYNQYSEKYDEAQNNERKTELNSAITQLHENEISYPDYYRTIDKDSDERYRFYRANIKASRKYEYRKNEQKVDRIKRHK
jgi:hypothetical protein